MKKKLTAGEYDVILNGIRLHYTIRGTGPALIAHSGGPGMDARDWDDFAKIDEFVTIICLHPRGSGLSDPAPNESYTLSDYAADLEALRCHLELDRPMILGWSHGGCVAQQFAITYPHSLSKLILFDTTACLKEFMGDIEGSVQKFKNEPWFEKSFAALKRELSSEIKTDEILTQLWEDEAKFYFKEFNARAQAYHDRTKHLMIRSAPQKFFTDHEAIEMDLRPELHKIQVPTLVIVGRHDFITGVGMAEEIASRIPQARLEIFENSGHFAVVEEPEKFYMVIKEFVEAPL